nr:MAG TPA: hypothetical protein [Caudoviricetes sp.]
MLLYNIFHYFFLKHVPQLFRQPMIEYTQKCYYGVLWLVGGGNMANLKAATRKLQKAILSTGLIIKIGTSQFYSHEQERLITVTIISTPVFRPTKRGEWKDCDYEILRTASQYDVVMCLKEIWEAVRQ